MSVRTRVRQRRFDGAVTEAFVSVIVAADHLTQETDALLDQHGITGDQYNVLRILRGAHPEGYARCDIQGRLMRRAPDVTRMLDRLERQGLVARVRTKEDRRLSIARITKEGLALLKTIDPELEALMQHLTSRLKEPQLRQLARLCDALLT